MHLQYHAKLTLGALRRWLIAQCYDSLLVGGLWWGVLFWLKVPWAPVWALLAGALQFIPHFGPLLALIGPALAMLFIRAPLMHWFYLLGAYAAITLMDSFVLQPYLMRRENRVPIWASVLTPIVLGIVLPFWGVLFAPPLLAVVYAYRRAFHATTKTEAERREERFSGRGEGIILPPENQPGRDE